MQYGKGMAGRTFVLRVEHGEDLLQAVKELARQENIRQEPVIHLHASWGRGDRVVTGCIREEATVYLMVEVFVWEITGLAAGRHFDQRLGLKALSFGAGTE
ncbi:MAG: PPC domain-containing DNA-binding protein [Desulfurispora sp.]|uniref:PPC domain-containing DNA-binding protein n=1 Tax=Desulfurispora sp. TaxID=3014275 RepID=UPI00404AA389